MTPDQKNKMNLRILSMLRDKGAPALSPFPGEQAFEAEDVDLDSMGDAVQKPMLPEELLPPGKGEKKGLEKKKKRPRMPARAAGGREEEPEFVLADESVPITGVN